MKTPQPEFASRDERLFYQALRIRLVEERIIDLYPSDRIQSPVHLSIGQEGVAVGACEPLLPTDLLFCSYRGHAFYLAKGGDLKAMFAELCGKVDGVSQGKAGSMHLAAPEVGLMGASAVVASVIPHAVGAALAARNRATGQVIVCAFGDGAAEEGVYHESLNFAALMHLPVVFLCENNGLAVHADLAQRQAFTTLDHARVYGLETAQVEDGRDFAAVADLMTCVVDATREDGKPRFLEVKTYRTREHVGPGEDFHEGYRTRDECDAWLAGDPLVGDGESVARFTPFITREIDEAVAFAEASPVPGRDLLLTDVIQ
jgi:TPP-dependent pyruvate/acetoin dehydrogenase alpha subunit